MNDAAAGSSEVGAAEPESAPLARLPLLFSRVEVLDSVQHLGLRRLSRVSYRFARGTNAVPLGYSEIVRAAQEYPVVFAGEGDTLHLVALVGLTTDTNILIDDAGQWQGRYVPAYLRSYPFALARTQAQASGRYTVVIDPDSSEFSETAGTPLFDPQGAPTAYLNRLIGFLRQYDAEVNLSRKFARRVDELGLLHTVNADVQLRSGKRFELTGMRVVEREALRALAQDARMELYDIGWLETIHHHLGSLQAFAQLVDKLAARIDD